MPDVRHSPQDGIYVKRIALPAGNRQLLLRRLTFQEFEPAEFWWRPQPPVWRPPVRTVPPSAAGRNLMILSAGNIADPPEPPAPVMKSIVTTEIYRLRRVYTEVDV